MAEACRPAAHDRFTKPIVAEQWAAYSYLAMVAMNRQYAFVAAGRSISLPLTPQQDKTEAGHEACQHSYAASGDPIVWLRRAMSPTSTMSRVNGVGGPLRRG